MRRSSLILLLIGLVLFTSPGYAKDLASRLGIGYSDQFSTDLPSMKVKYYPSNDIAFSAALGTDTLKDRSKFGLSARMYKTIFSEENLIFYGGLGGGILSVEHGGKADSGFELAGFFGAEFFIPGLDNLGISFDAGLGVTSVSTGVRFRTVADHPLRAGIIFYF
jgi:hypothetical protein